MTMTALQAMHLLMPPAVQCQAAPPSSAPLAPPAILDSSISGVTKEGVSVVSLDFSDVHPRRDLSLVPDHGSSTHPQVVAAHRARRRCTD